MSGRVPKLQPLDNKMASGGGEVGGVAGHLFGCVGVGRYPFVLVCLYMGRKTIEPSPELAPLIPVLLFWGPLCFPLTRQKNIWGPD